MFYVTLALLLTTAVYAYFSYRQTLELEESNRRTDNIIQLGVDNLRTANKASIEAHHDVERSFANAETQNKTLIRQASALRDQAKSVADQAASLRKQTETIVQEKDLLSRETEALSAQAASMKTLADANKSIADAAGVSATATKSAAETSAKQLAITDRALIRVDVELDQPLEFFTQPVKDMALPKDFLTPEVRSTLLTTYGDPVSMVFAHAVFKLMNSGRSVASDVRLSWGVYFVGPHDIFLADGADERAKRRCESAETLTSLLGSDTLFPGEKRDVQEMGDEGIRLNVIHPPTHGLFYRLDAKSIEPLIVGCVTYTFATATEPHRTWFTYRVGQRFPQRRRAPVQTWDFEIGKNVPTRRIFLQRMIGGNGAD